MACRRLQYSHLCDKDARIHKLDQLQAEHAGYSDIDLSQMKLDADTHGWVSPRRDLYERENLGKFSAVAKAMQNIKEYVGAAWNRL